MTTLVPRSPYTDEELARLYPKELELQLVQVLHRHGERSPVTARFVNAGLPPHWPYCHAAKRFRSVVLSPNGEQNWDSLQWRRRLEKFGPDDGPVIASGPNQEIDGICQHGELSDRGRETTFALGQRLRHLYVDQLKFMPKLIANADLFYLRSTPIPRALESLQETFWGMYPLTARTASFPSPTIVTRTPADETLYPNEGNCRRLAQLARAFANRCANRWNDSKEMQHVNKLLSKWMPEDSKTVAIDSHPRLVGIMDTINATLAHGPDTMLPKEFYDETVLWAINYLPVEEWYAGYRENREYRTLGIGGLMGDIVERMVVSVEAKRSRDQARNTNGGDSLETDLDGGQKGVKFALSGCHDTTMAAIMTSLGAFEGEKWPPFTSHIAIEMFCKKSGEDKESSAGSNASVQSSNKQTLSTQKPGWLASMLGLSSSNSSSNKSTSETDPVGRAPYVSLDTNQKDSLQGYYVRVRYNDEPVTLPACAQPGNHLEGDEGLCTLETFKRVVDSFTPKHWKAECANLDKPIYGLQLKAGDVGEQKSGSIEEGF